MLAIERLFCEELFRIHRRQARFLDGLQATASPTCSPRTRKRTTC